LPLLPAFVYMSCSTQMLANKAAGAPNWFHPRSLTSGAQYSNTSPAMLARQAAYGTLAAAWHLYTGGRPAECFRLRWGDTGMPGAGNSGIECWIAWERGRWCNTSGIECCKVEERGRCSNTSGIECWIAWEMGRCSNTSGIECWIAWEMGRCSNTSGIECCKVEERGRCNHTSGIECSSRGARGRWR
jgi:hypothetical protein